MTKIARPDGNGDDSAAAVPKTTTKPSSSDQVEEKASRCLKLLQSLNQGNYHHSDTNPLWNEGGDGSNPSDDNNEKNGRRLDDSKASSRMTVGVRAESESTSNNSQLAISWALRQIRKSYRERLETFAEPSGYFAKPIDISPLVCARFGWQNTSRNVLKCSNSACGAVIHVEFHPSLSHRSYETLTGTYRRLLADSHCASCPFRADAERWLILGNDDDGGGKVGGGDGGDGGDDGESWCVPPYLLSMSREFGLFEDCTTEGFVVKDVVAKEAKTIGIAMEIIQRCSGGDGSEVQNAKGNSLVWSTFVAEEVVNRLSVIGGGGTDKGGDGAGREDVRQKIMACLAIDTEACPPPPTTEQRSGDATNDEQRQYITGDSALLAVFGWRFVPWSSSPSTTRKASPKVLQLTCRLCLATAPIPYQCRPVNNHDPTNIQHSITIPEARTPLKKRRRIDPPSEQCNDPPPVSPPAPPFDVLNSHRHFCPYVSGFARSSAVSPPKPSLVGWERVVDALMRPRRDGSSILDGARGGKRGTAGSGNDMAGEDRRCIDGEEIFRKLRRALQS